MTAMAVPATLEVDRTPRQLRVVLVCMPWLGLHLPSLALSTLAPLGRSQDCVSRLDVRYANLEWAEFVHSATGGRIGSREYLEISESDFSAIGEWIFSGSLYDEADPGRTEYYQSLSAGGRDMTEAARMYRLAISFVARLADELSSDYDIVGCTSTFVQNVPSLALAQAVKRRAPEVTVVFGGANCDEEQGAAMHRNFPFIDYVVRGEAEVAFPQLLSLIAEEQGATAAGIAGLCWRYGPDSVANPMPGSGVSMDVVPEPAYDEYFTAFDSSTVCADVVPRIVLEGARGCWWGQKHHCTFCGLNNSLMPFRAKEPDRVFAELQRAVTAHQVLDVVFADNILDQRYVRELLPRLGDLGWDLRIFFEVKANQVYSQIELMARAGVIRVQPGIESFSTNVLKLMRKGVTGWQNVRFLRDCRTLGIDPMWNLLYGFPGETDDDYQPMVSQLPNLIHLKPPQGACRVSLTRFSPFFDDPSLGMRNLGPERSYLQVYRLPEKEVADLIYLFRSPHAGVGDALAEQLEANVGTWMADGGGRSLAAVPDGAGTAGEPGLVLVDERDARRVKEYILPPSAARAYRALLKGRSATGLATALASDPLAGAPGPMTDLLAHWAEAGLVYQDGDYYVALATGLAY